MGSKTDVEDLQKISEREGKEFAEKLCGNCAHFQVSAKTGENIEDVFQKVCLMLVDDGGTVVNYTDGSVIQQKAIGKEKKGCC